MATNIDKFVEPGELPAGSGVPLGGIIMWMNPAAASLNPTPPAGYEYCDGTAVVTGGSPFIGQVKPNLMVTSGGGQLGMPRGADVNSAPYGVGTAIVTGGVDSHVHGGGTSSDGAGHTHSMQGHTHSMQTHTHNTPSGGSHGHGFTGTANQSGVPSTGGSYQGGAFFHNHSVGTGSSSHSHTTNGPSVANTGSPSSSSTGSGSSNHGHTISSDSQSNVPFFSAVAFIVRVL